MGVVEFVPPGIMQAPGTPSGKSTVMPKYRAAALKTLRDYAVGIDLRWFQPPRPPAPASGIPRGKTFLKGKQS
jgi:hypothetical protein